MGIKGIPIKEFPYCSQKYIQESQNWNCQDFLPVNLGSKHTADPCLWGNTGSQLHIPPPKDLSIYSETFKENLRSDKCTKVPSTSSV